MKALKRILSLLLCIAMLLIAAVPCFATTDSQIDKALVDTAKYVYETVKAPQVGSIGGEWAVMGLARSGYDISEKYFQEYYSAVEEYVKACNGVLHEKKYTEYSRVIIALSSIGKDARSVAGYDLTYVLGDYEKTIWQGINGPIWALIALDSGNYPVPENKEAAIQATRQMYVDRILECQLSDGGWSLVGDTGAETTVDIDSDPDITGMALQALAKYQDQPKVKKAVNRALICMSEKQKNDGGFSSWGTANSESCVQMIVALCELGVSLDDSRFVKNGKTLADNLMDYYLPGNGFKHIKEGVEPNQMATEQALYCLVALNRVIEGKNSLYSMDDAIKIADIVTEPELGMKRHPDVRPAEITKPGKSFADISGVNAHENQIAIEALAARGIISGYNETTFGPDDTLTRAQFATIVVLSLGLPLGGDNPFADVSDKSWYAQYVKTAYKYGIVKGTSETTFSPAATITRQAAAVMVTNAAKLCGLDTEMANAQVRDTLAQFGDYVKSADWARASLAYCYDSDILNQNDISIRPKDSIKRCEIAQMLFNMLGISDML